MENALAGRGGMADLLWSHAWLSDIVAFEDDYPDEASFSDTRPLAEIGSIDLSRKARMKLRFRQTFGSGAWAA
jgi:hypothetical protein